MNSSCENKRYLRINPLDNVAVAIAEDLLKGEAIEIAEERLTLRDDVPTGHKFALFHIKKGEKIMKYGNPIGIAVADIEPGERVHSHNMATSLGDNLTYSYNPIPIKRLESSSEAPLVNGYLRKNGEMGIRNDLWILPTVGCVNGSAQAIAKRLKEEFGGLQEIDDIMAFTHNYGCSQLGADHVNTRKSLAAMARHPNAGGVIVIGLGCENNKISELREEIGDYDSERVRFIVAQDVEDEVEAGVETGRELIKKMRADRRQPLPISTLKVGLKCGGSDGLSGITANPLVGLLSDKIVAWGGTTVLTEVPEMFGAETILMGRAKDKDVFDKEVRLINDFKDYFRQSCQPIYENPSPGNKAGGITTLEEKSLGCVQKGGNSAVVDVVDYAAPISAPGLNLLQAPGNDLVASTALALSGCQMVIFTTGRGTPFGTCVPTIKISTNSRLAEKKPNWIDFNAGRLVEGESFETALQILLEEILKVADGKKVRQEVNGYKDIAIFKTGVTL